MTAPFQNNQKFNGSGWNKLGVLQPQWRLGFKNAIQLLDGVNNRIHKFFWSFSTGLII
jgi:hypothetical protein